MLNKQLMSSALSVFVATVALGAWGLKYEVSPDGVAWGPVIATGPGSTVHFRMSAYFDIGTQISTIDGVGNAIAVNRFTGQQQVTGMVPGDAIQNMSRLAPTGNAALLQVNVNLIGLTVATSFASQLIPDLNPYVSSPQTLFPILKGDIVLGSDTGVRTLTILNKQFGTGSAKGLTFYNDASLVNKFTAAPVDDPNHTDLPATILVGGGGTCPPVDSITVGGGGSVSPSQTATFTGSAFGGAFFSWLKNGAALTEGGRFHGVYTSTLTISQPYLSDAGSYRVKVYSACGTPKLSGAVQLSVVCGSDLTRDGLVEDSDFVIFANAYSALLCPDPVALCAADLNLDGVVDDGDFVIFSQQYNDLMCP